MACLIFSASDCKPRHCRNVKVYEFKSSRTKQLPDEDDKDLKLKGEGVYPYIDIHSNYDLRKVNHSYVCLI